MISLITKRGQKFNKYIRKFGHMLQYSVYEIENSEKLLNNIATEINSKWLKRFDESDSVYIFQMSSSCKVQKLGFARHEDEDLLLVQSILQTSVRM